MPHKVLFVDDEKNLLEALQRVFKCYGFVPYYTTSGKQALEIMEQEHIRVFFIDLRMPEIDGVELCRRIKEIDSGAYVYAVSAYINAFKDGELTEVGFNGCFKKPFDFTQLIAACKEAFKELGQPDQI